MAILIGKAIPGLVIGALEASFIIALAVYWFDIPLRGGLGALYLGLFLFLLSAVGIGLMISAICVTQQQAVSVTTQLAQGLSSGQLAGDELKSLTENAGGLAAALEKLGQTEEMVAHLKRYLELAPDAPDAADVARLIEAAEGS